MMRSANGGSLDIQPISPRPVPPALPGTIMIIGHKIMIIGHKIMIIIGHKIMIVGHLLSLSITITSCYHYHILYSITDAAINHYFVRTCYLQITLPHLSPHRIISLLFLSIRWLAWRPPLQRTNGFFLVVVGIESYLDHTCTPGIDNCVHRVSYEYSHATPTTTR